MKEKEAKEIMEKAELAFIESLLEVEALDATLRASQRDSNLKKVGYLVARKRYLKILKGRINCRHQKR